jgi:hypothetical protein
MAIAFQGRLDEKAFRRAQLAHLGGKPTLGCLAAVILVMLFGLISPLFGREDVGAEDIALPIGIVIAAVVLVLVYRRWMRKAWTSNRLVQTAMSGEADDEALRLETEYSKTRVPWNMFLKYRMTLELVAIYGAQNLFFLFPRSFFSSDREWDEFRVLVAAKVPAAAKKDMGSTVKTAILWAIIVIAAFILWSLFGNTR